MGDVKKLVDGVSVRPLDIIKDERGAVLHMLRSDAKEFCGFGEAYFSLVKTGIVKAWKRHRKMVQNLAVPVGSIRLVIYDDRPGSSTCGIVSNLVTGQGVEQYELIHLPAMVWYGFAGTGNGDSMIANCASLPHDPSEVDRLPMDSELIPFRWS